MKLICYGDSNTWGYDPRNYFGGRYELPWPDRLAKISGWQVINEGQCGRRIPREISLPPRDLLILMLGTNDLLQGLSAREVGFRMAALLKTLRSPVLLLAPPPLASGTWTQDPALRQRSQALAGEYAALAAGQGILFCDPGQWSIPMAYDGVHFTQEGHLFFAENLAEFLKQHL